MSHQDPSFSLDFPQEMSMNHLSTAAHHHSSAAVPPKATSGSLEKYTTGCGNSKRPSHLSALSSQEPSSKRANLNQASPPAAVGGGYMKLPPPMSFPVATRSHSHPARTSSGTILNPPPQEISNAIQRTVSDPSPFRNLGTPPRPPLARISSGSPICGDSPSMKRLMRMKERMKEMSEWWNQVLSEGDEDDREFENHNSDNIPKEESETETENPSQEAVWVETNGDGLVLNFRCPCGDGYQILLSGNNCYYKLISS